MEYETRNTLVSEDVLLRMYRDMVLVREFEETAAEQYARGNVYGFLHLYSGEEAVAVGAIHALRSDDYVVSAYRDHGHAIVKGSDPKAVMAELFGRKTGLCGGKGGSMHLFDPSHRFMGGYAIVGGMLPIAAGIGQAIRYRRGDEVVACFFGDGAINEGAVHEALNLAGLWKLPLVLLLENNYYGMGTYVGRASAVEHLSDRAIAYGISGERIDGNNVLEVLAATRSAVERARKGGGPTLIEAVTYRLRGHSMSDPKEYRTPRELKIWRQRDPIPRFGAFLEKGQHASADDLERIDQEVHDQVQEAVRFAEQSPPPDPAALYQNVYDRPHPGLGGPAWRG